MKEWILNNTNISEEEYDSLLNLDTVMIDGKTNNPKNDGPSKHPIININKFTLDYPTYSRRKKFKIKRVKDINNRNLYIYKNIRFYILGECFPKIANETFTTERLRRCFYINSQICLLPNINTYLITAMCKSPFRASKKEYVHTFVLLKHTDGTDYILDGTNNTIIDKKTYFEIFEPKVISCIDREKLKRDLELLKPFEGNFSICRPEYLCFPKKTTKTAKKLSRKKTTNR